MLTVQQALDRLKSAGITDSAQILRRWLRNGVIKGIPAESKRTGWHISEEEINRFIRERNPLYAENQMLKAEIERLRKQLRKQQKTTATGPVKSPLIYFGGKYHLAKHIIPLMPAHRAYCEPFGGGAHVLVQKSPVPYEIYNDIDENLVNFLMIARDRPDELASKCETLPYSRKLFEEWRDSPMPDDPLERAVRFFYINRSQIAKGNGPAGKGTGWRHSAKVNPAQAYHSAIEMIHAFSLRMRKVQIECRDFREIIQVYDTPDTLFYVDPPYIGREKHYLGGFTEKDHRDLAHMLNNIQGKAIVSYYYDPLLDELYPGWVRKTLDANRQIIGKKEKGKATELLLFNYPVDKIIVT
jgi:DNA adenine methylase